MKSNLKNFEYNVIFTINIFVIFLLLFENKMVVPQWLQPFGRMHPMILHFLIVILILAMVLEFFRFKTEYIGQEFYQKFTSQLLLIGVLSSGVTVIMGLFLSKEEGYAGSALQWHKWSGVSIFFAASLVYWCRNYSWYNEWVAKAFVFITIFFIFGAGHYGATLTHGDNFILAPVTSVKEPVSLEQAMVFEHVIQPIFQNKCTGCHNREKIKGELILTDSAAILKGGKTGKLFIPGKPASSLLLKRIYLPIENKKHMPPADKTQLTPIEVTLLNLWVNANADFKKKVTELPQNDSLRILSTAFLNPDEKNKERFTFAAADQRTIQKLNNNYRVVSLLAQDSPALTVSLFNRTVYTSKALEELIAVKRQIVSLDLNKMPVKDSDLKIIAQFENLQTLHLNFTDITGAGLKELSSLKNLETLSLSGTKASYQDLQWITDIKRLSQVAIWSMQLKEEEIERLKRKNKGIEFITGFRDDGKVLKLNPPQLKNSSVVFRNTLIPDLKHPVQGVQIRYSMDGSEPDSIKSEVFKSGIVLKKSTSIKAKAYKAGWLGSDVVVFNFYKSTHKPDTVNFLQASANRAGGTHVFFDGRMGDFNKKNNKWISFKENNMEVSMVYKEPVMMTSVALHILVLTEEQVFPPTAIEIWGGTNKGRMKLLSMLKPPVPAIQGKPELTNFACKFNPASISFLKVIAKPLKKIPDWHEAKGKSALLVIDEILIN